MNDWASMPDKMLDKVVTRALIDRAINSARSRTEPYTFIVSVETKIAFDGHKQGWNWRRIKREVRKGARSTYRK